ncbi:hypothetical protein D3C81_1172470 [compost metagenome]
MRQARGGHVRRDRRHASAGMGRRGRQGRAEQHRGRFLARQRAGERRPPLLADGQGDRCGHGKHAQTVQGVLQGCPAAAQQGATRHRVGQAHLQRTVHTGNRLSEADLQRPPDTGKMKGFPTAHTYLHPLPAARVRTATRARSQRTQVRMLRHLAGVSSTCWRALPMRPTRNRVRSWGNAPCH